MKNYKEFIWRNPKKDYNHSRDFSSTTANLQILQKMKIFFERSYDNNYRMRDMNEGLITTSISALHLKQ